MADDEREARGDEESTKTVLVAGSANLAIAVAKLVGGVLSGSSAMLAEAAHSFADTLNQVFLMTALRRSGKPADGEHQFGYGMERYFWSLLAAVGIFVLGAGFAIHEGITAMLGSSEVVALPLTFGILAVSLVFEGTSWLRAVAQVRRQSQSSLPDTVDAVRSASDPTVKAVVFEDTAALVGIVLAAVGIGLHAWTHNAFWDGLASVLIGLLLVAVAYSLGRENKAMLLGRSLDGEALEQLSHIIESVDGIDHTIEVLTMRLGPDEVLLATRVDIGDNVGGDSTEHVADQVELAIRQAFPEVRHVFVDPTPERRAGAIDQ